MFASFPTFEELTIHLQVEWCERQRPIEVRLEKWPQSRGVVLVCHFEDDPEYGEWVVLDGRRRPHFVGKPEKLLFTRTQWNIATRCPFTTRHFKEKQLERLKTVVRLAFGGYYSFRVGRVLEIPDWSGAPRLLLWHSDSAWWCRDWDLWEVTRFGWSPSPLHLSPRQMQDSVSAKWNEADSDMRFAWQWANWDEAERLRQSTGYQGDFGELEQVMKWVLTCLPTTGDKALEWTWNLLGHRLGIETEIVYFLHAYSDQWEDTQDTDEDRFIKVWSDLLSAHFLPHWRRDWTKHHVCVREFWASRSLCEVERDEPPTMHERLEARLELRDWLQQNAPDQADLPGTEF